MKKTLLALSLMIAIAAWQFMPSANSYSSTPPAAKTGALGQNNCTQCHGGTANAESGSIVVDIVADNDTVEQDSVYTISVVVTRDAGGSKYGFELMIVDTNGNHVGTSVITNSNNSQIITSNNETYIAHKNANSNRDWTFEWTAPSTYAGPVTIYAAGLGSVQYQSDNDVFTGSRTIYVRGKSTSTSIEELAIENKVYPTLSNGIVNVEVSQAAEVSVYQLNGQLVQTLTVNGTSQINDLITGMYLITIDQAGKKDYHKVVVE